MIQNCKIRKSYESLNEKGEVEECLNFLQEIGVAAFTTIRYKRNKYDQLHNL